jgi:hypothetical protein
MGIEEKIQARVDALKEAREKLVNDTNHQIELLNLAIGELEAIIAPDETNETPA